MPSSELLHYGVKGMQWGVRNEDKNRSARASSSVASRARTQSSIMAAQRRERANVSENRTSSTRNDALVRKNYERRGMKKVDYSDYRQGAPLTPSSKSSKNSRNSRYIYATDKEYRNYLQTGRMERSSSNRGGDIASMYENAMTGEEFLALLEEKKKKKDLMNEKVSNLTKNAKKRVEAGKKFVKDFGNNFNYGLSKMVERGKKWLEGVLNINKKKKEKKNPLNVQRSGLKQTKQSKQAKAIQDKLRGKS